MDVKIEPSWKEALKSEFNEPYFKSLTDKIRAEYHDPRLKIFPKGSQIFAAFDATPFHETKVVIIGQDPYHGPGQANGLCFSVNPGIPFPPSLLNIFKEIAAEFGSPMPINGDLTRWAKQGVLLLNSTLTVRESQPRSHFGLGWEQFTDKVVRIINSQLQGVVFLLWGSDAQKKGRFIDKTKHLVLTSAHPSPLSAYRGFFGNNHFKLTNEYLIKNNKQPINW